MTANPYESPETAGELPQPKTNLPKLVLRLLIAVGILGLVVAMLLPAVRVSREPARRMQCGNNLKQIALALQTYADTYHFLPPAYTVDAAGRPLHSWRTLILPFLENKALYDRLDLSKPWDDPANREAFEPNVPIFRCPSGNLAKDQTTYMAVIAPSGCFQPTEPRALADITDKYGLTLIVIEVPDEHAVHWMSPNDASEELIMSLNSAEKSPHPTGAMAACVDGHTFLLRRNSNPAALRALISIAGKDDDLAQAAD